MLHMGIADILSKDRVTVDLHANNRQEALTEVARSLANRHPELGPGRIYDSLWGRECLGSTGIGDGVAIPHARIAGLTETELVVATCPDGIEFEAADGKPVRILVGILSPAEEPRQALRTLADVVRCLKNPAVREALEHASTPEAVVQALMDDDSPKA